MRFYRLVSVFMVMAVLTFCSREEQDGEYLQIVTTTGMIGDIATIIGGEFAEVEVLMGPGIDPHLYKATEKDLLTLSSADIIFYNGLHLEAQMGDVMENMIKVGILTVAVGDRIPETELIEVEGGMHDPHVWMNPNLWKYAVQSVTETYITVDPDHTSNYAAAYTNYMEELTELDTFITDSLALIPEKQRVLISAHDAFSYFGKAYGVQVEGIQGISTMSEASASSIRGLADLIVEAQVPAVFIETSVSSKTIEALKEAVKSRGAEISIGGTLYSDALGDVGSGAETYTGMIRANVETISSALSGKAHE